MIIIKPVIKVIDWLAEWSGLTFRWLAVLVMLTMTFEVIMRYVFNNPTAWSYDTTIMLGGALFILSTPYVLLHNRNIRIDLFYARYSPRMQKIVDLVFAAMFLLTAIGVFTQQAWKYALWSLEVGEISQFGYWEPSMTPYRFAVAVGFTLLALESVSWFIRELYAVTTGKSLVTLKEGNG